MWYRALITSMLALSLLVVTGCSDEEDVAETQRKSIESFLTSSHSPRLIAKENIAESLERNPAFYDRIEYDTYRYIATYYDEGRASKHSLREGDEVELVFTAYIFKGSAPSTSDVYLTNDATTVAALRQEGLNVDYWSLEPLRVKIGQTNIIKGIEQSLIGCCVGDQVEVYMTLNVAYDDNVVGVVPKDSSVAWYYTIYAVGE